MSRKFFGTDGIRGKANSAELNAALALKIGMATGRHFVRGDHRHRAVIGKDTRLSGYLFENALTSGLTSVGMDVVLVGPMPTPAVAMLTKSLRADVGIMISASHNPYYDNGIKLFGPDGYKLSDDVERRIENLMETALNDPLAPPENIGRARRLDDVEGRYIEFAKNSFPRGQSLEGLKLVVDCANGAGYHVAPRVFWELGAEVATIGVEPNGFNINDGVGSTKPEAMAQAVLDHKADLGIALDGDADRLVLADEKGQLVDGDQMIGLIAPHWARLGQLKGGRVACTVMSNMGLERYLAASDIAMERTPVGDRYVVEYMKDHDLNLGGEQSGHIIMRDFATTGDGIIAALQILSILKYKEQPASEVCRVFDPLPQRLENIPIDGGDPLAAGTVKEAIAAAENKLGPDGRLLIRKSGTEPAIRVMAESADLNLVQSVIEDVSAAIKQSEGT